MKNKGAFEKFQETDNCEIKGPVKPLKTMIFNFVWLNHVAESFRVQKIVPKFVR